MSFPCPHCGGEIVVVPGSSPFPGWRNPVALESQSVSQSRSQTSSQAQVAHGFELQDQELPAKKSRAYNQDYIAHFIEFWAVYPRHQDKRKAAQAWRNAVARLVATGIAIVDARTTLVSGAIRYRDDPNRLEEFTKYAATWLNADAWEDEPLPVRLNGKEPGAAKPMHDEDYRRLLEER